MKKQFQRVCILIAFLSFSFAVSGNISSAKAKTYSISPNSKPCNKNFTKSPAYNKNTKHYFLIRSYLEKLQKTGGTLNLKKGNYKVCSTLYIPSNVTIKLKSKSKIIKTNKSGTKKCLPTKYLFQLATKKQAKKASIKAYKATRNSSIIGATNSTIDLGNVQGAIGISMAHNYNINIEKINFKNRYGGSYIAMAGVKKATIKTCKFYAGTMMSGYENYFDIRLEVANKTINTLGFSWSSLDNTTNQNITVQDNTFTGMLGAVGTTKYAYVKSPVYQEKIKIQKNTFKNLSGTVIKGMVWNNATISNNKFNRTDKIQNTPYGIYLYGVNEPVINKNSFNYIKIPIRFSLAKNSGKGSKSPSVKNNISNSNTTLIRNNTVNNLKNYYVLYNNGSETRLTYYLDKKDNKLTFSKTSSPYRDKYKDYASYEANTKDYFLFRSYVEQLEDCGGGTLTVKKDTYNISNAIHIPSNVTIHFEDGVVINKIVAKYTTSLTVPKALFVFVAPSLANAKGTVKGYNGTQNVIFSSNGKATIDCNYENPGQGIILGHNKNITISNIDFKREKGYHFIELNSSNNVTIKNCTFQDFQSLSKATDDGETDMTYKECINIDGTDKLTNGFNYVWSAYDKTVCNGVIINDCEFINVGTAIGSHTYITNGNTQVYHENIKIHNNLIKNTLNSGIRSMNWKNAEITDNRFENIGYSEPLKKYGYYLYGIYLRGVIDPLVKNNTFTNCNYAIYVKKTETSKPASTKYPDTVCSIRMERWNDMLENTMIDCDIKSDKIRLSNDFLESELPEDFKNATFSNITHENR